MNQEQIEQIEKCINDVTDCLDIVESYTLEGSQEIKRLTRQAAQAIAAMWPKWVSCSERLPEEKQTDDPWEKGSSERVLVYLNGVWASGVYWHTTERWSLSGFTGDWRPSHWMKIPPPPTPQQS